MTLDDVTPASPDVAAVMEAIGRLFPVTVEEGPEYATLIFGDGHQTRAMTMQPDDWRALSDGLPALVARVATLEAENGRLKPLAAIFLREAERARKAIGDVDVQ